MAHFSFPRSAPPSLGLSSSLSEAMTGVICSPYGSAPAPSSAALADAPSADPLLMTETRNGSYPPTATKARSAGNVVPIGMGFRRERGSSGEWGSGPPSSESSDCDGSRTAAAVAASQPLSDKTGLAKVDHEVVQ